MDSPKIGPPRVRNLFNKFHNGLESDSGPGGRRLLLLQHHGDRSSEKVEDVNTQNDGMAEPLVSRPLRRMNIVHLCPALEPILFAYSRECKNGWGLECRNDKLQKREKQSTHHLHKEFLSAIFKDRYDSAPLRAQLNQLISSKAYWSMPNE